MRLKLLADEDFDRNIVRGLLWVEPGVDVLRVQDIGLARSPDPVVLERAAQEGRIVITHDVSTMTDYAYERVRQDLPMPGVFVAPQTLPIGRAINDLLVLIECSLDGEWKGQVRYLPL